MENQLTNYQVIPYPDLENWTTSLEAKLDRILSNYILTNYDQSTIFMGKIIAMAYTIAEYGHSPTNCADQVEEDLNFLFSRYFKRHAIQVEYELSPDDDARYHLRIHIYVNDGTGDSVNVQMLYEIQGSRLHRVVKANNDGVKVYERVLPN